MEDMKIETTLKKIEVYRDEEPGDRKGHVEVQVRLLRDDVVTVNLVRVYFTSEDVTVRDLIDSAFQRAHRAIHQTASLCGSESAASDQPLWIE